MDVLEQQIIMTPPGTFDLSPGDAMYWTELLSHTYLTNLYALQQAGFKFRQSAQTLAQVQESAFIEPETAPETSLSWLRHLVNVGTGGGGEVGILTLPPALWQAQNSLIDEQTARLEWLKEAIGEDAAGNTGITGILKDFGSWFLQESIEQVLGEYIEHQFLVFDLFGEFGDDAADWISSALVNGAVWLIDYFEKRAAPGVRECQVMIDENNSIRDIEESSQHYEFRQQILAAHASRMQYLESQLVEADGVLFDVVKTIVSIIQGFMSSSGDAEEDDWAEELTTITQETDKIRQWLDDMEEKDAADLPVPVPPSLPSPPSGGSTKLKVLYMLAKFGFRLYTEIMRKQRETDTHVTDLVEAVKDLKFNEMELNIPNSNTKVNLFSQALRYGGK
jgi:hypothetical protein